MVPAGTNSPAPTVNGLRRMSQQHQTTYRAFAPSCVMNSHGTGYSADHLGGFAKNTAQALI